MNDEEFRNMLEIPWRIFDRHVEISNRRFLIFVILAFGGIAVLCSISINILSIAKALNE